MKNLVEKFTPETTEIEDDGVVAIEYVLVGAAVVAGVGVTFATTGLWTTMLNELNGLFA